MGLTPRVMRVDSNLMPYESTSFPSSPYGEVLAETWEDSDLLSRVEYMLFLPLHGPTKKTPQAACTFGKPRFWRPTTDDLGLIRREWELYRLEIERGMAKRLTPASEYRRNPHAAACIERQGHRRCTCRRTRGQEEFLAQSALRRPDPSRRALVPPASSRPTRLTAPTTSALPIMKARRRRHVGVGPVVREAVEAFELDRG